MSGKSFGFGDREEKKHHNNLNLRVIYTGEVHDAVDLTRLIKPDETIVVVNEFALRRNHEGSQAQFRDYVRQYPESLEALVDERPELVQVFLEEARPNDKNTLHLKEDEEMTVPRYVYEARRAYYSLLEKYPELFRFNFVIDNGYRELPSASVSFAFRNPGLDR